MVRARLRAVSRRITLTCTPGRHMYWFVVGILITNPFNPNPNPKMPKIFGQRLLLGSFLHFQSFAGGGRAGGRARERKRKRGERGENKEKKVCTW